MKRFHQIAAAAALAAVAWLVACITAPTGLARISALTAPVWTASLLALYLLAQLVHGVLTFKSYPAAISELQQEVEEARRGLQAVGITTG